MESSLVEEPLIGQRDLFRPIGADRSLCCCSVNEKRLAVAAAVYSMIMSIVTFLGYLMLALTTSYRSEQLEDVYWGVQASYAAVLVAEMTAFCLSIALLVAIHQENTSLMTPWVLGFIGSLSLEALAIVYSNILRDHVNQCFDRLSMMEGAIFLAKLLINILVIGVIVRLYRLLRNGVTWLGDPTYEL